MIKKNKLKNRDRLIRFGLPISIVITLIMGIFSLDKVLGEHSPYVALSIIFFLKDWKALTGLQYITIYAFIQLFIIVLVLAILILKSTDKVDRKRRISTLFLILSMGSFVLIIALVVIWTFSGIMDQAIIDALNDLPEAPINYFFDISISIVLPILMIAFGFVALIFWLIYYIPSLSIPIKKYKFNYSVFKNSQTPWQGKDKELKIICWCGILIACAEFGITVFSIYCSNSDTEIYPSILAKIWFGTMHHFTELSNLWVAIFFIIFLLNYKFKFLHTGTIVTMTFTYITVTFLIADFLLAPFILINHSSGIINMGLGGQTQWWDLVKTALFHVVQPIMVLIFFIFFCKSKRQYQPYKFSFIVPITMIFPVLYLVYAITINYLPIQHLTVEPDGTQHIIYGGISVYGYFTCINPNIHANVYQSPDDGTSLIPLWTGKPFNGVWYAFGIILFLVLSFYYNWIERYSMAMQYINKIRFNKKHVRYKII